MEKYIIRLDDACEKRDVKNGIKWNRSWINMVLNRLLESFRTVKTL